MDFANNNPGIIYYYRGTMVPDESLIQTILVNSGKFKLCNDDKRYSDYSNTTTGSPRTLTKEDIPQITNGQYHFARKLDVTVDATLLDVIDKILIKTK